MSEYITQEDFKSLKQCYYDDLIRQINKINHSSSRYELNHTTIEAVRIIIKLNEINEKRLNTDDLNSGGL